jgi:hypothetical protein
MIMRPQLHPQEKQAVFRSVKKVTVLAIAACALSLGAQTDPGGLQTYFTGKEVTLKIDMPGTQQGVDLSLNKDTPMNWKQYSSRLKSFGVAIPKGATARVTTIVVKNDRIEFQLDGGGFGTFGDDSDATVAAKTVDKSDYEKRLQREIANTTDEDKRRQLQRELDRERARRERQNANNRDAAQIASQIKAQKVSDDRLRGGSRFNLRWQGAIPDDQKTPDGIKKLLADYVTFDDSPPTQSVVADGGIPATAQLKRGMKMEEVTSLFGPGQQVSQSISPEGLKTQTIHYLSGDRQVEVIYVEGLVVKYSISSN